MKNMLDSKRRRFGGEMYEIYIFQLQMKELINERPAAKIKPEKIYA